MALQPQLGTVPERRPWPDSADRRNSDAAEGVLTRVAQLDNGAAPPFAARNAGGDAAGVEGTGFCSSAGFSYLGFSNVADAAAARSVAEDA